MSFDALHGLCFKDQYESWQCWVQAFDDCTTVASIFKLLDSFEGLLDRGVIAADLERKHLDLVSGYGQDLKEVADMFRETKEDPPLNKNAAPHSGRVTWVRGLKERVAGTPCFPFFLIAYFAIFCDHCLCLCMLTEFAAKPVKLCALDRLDCDNSRDCLRCMSCVHTYNVSRLPAFCASHHRQQSAAPAKQ